MEAGKEASHPDDSPVERKHEPMNGPTKTSAQAQPITVTLPKKSWADLVKPVASAPSRDDAGRNILLLQQPLSKASIQTGRSSVISPQPFVVTSEEERQHTAAEKIQRLGEILVSKNLLGAEKKFDHRTLFLTPRGMMNRGNACYMNAVLQTLIFCPPFFHLLGKIMSKLILLVSL